MNHPSAIEAFIALVISLVVVVVGLIVVFIVGVVVVIVVIVVVLNAFTKGDDDNDGDVCPFCVFARTVVSRSV